MFICIWVHISTSHTTRVVTESGFWSCIYIFYSNRSSTVINLQGLGKYEISHTGDGQTDRQTRTYVRRGKIYEFVQSNAVTHAVTERRTLMTKVIIDTFWHALTRRISLVWTNKGGYTWYGIKPLVLSGPAGPIWHKSGLNRVLYPTFTGRFAKRPSYVQSSHRCSHLGIALNLLGLSEIASFLIIVLKLYSYIESDVGNLRTLKYFRDYCGLFHNTRNTI